MSDDRNQAGQYGVGITPAVVVPPSTHFWRVEEVRKLRVGENGGRHAAFVDIFDENGRPLRGDKNVKVAWGWEGQRADEAAPPKAPDKPEGEPMAVVDLYPRAKTWIQIIGDGVASERVTGLTTALPDEGPDVTYGHHSYYIRLRKMLANGQQPPDKKPDLPDDPEKVYLPYISAIVGTRLEQAMKLILSDLEAKGIKVRE